MIIFDCKIINQKAVYNSRVYHVDEYKKIQENDKRIKIIETKH